MNLGAIFLGGYFSYYKVSLSRLRFESFRKGRKILRNHTQTSQICFDFPSVLGFCLESLGNWNLSMSMKFLAYQITLSLTKINFIWVARGHRFSHYCKNYFPLR